ncbi:XRE family transcriptional regulator [Streptomyces sp. NBC_01224]|uniref:helix-turn-helix domain-containing protein n=1 Tax=Streptomyces sp. NBC_01224 TaxID=2903783 RepID=UPI002E149FF9|nr:XRE family transcriptional regulator [Streptomyces sp. NBC_01224]
MKEQATARWQHLPDSLGPDGLLLVERLRDLKQQTGLSLAALATRTAHSKSSWHRYLNGVKLPPRTAVEALGRLGGTEMAPLVALWENACRAETRPLSAAPQPPAPQPPAPRLPLAVAARTRRLRTAVVLAVSATLGAVACAVGAPALSGGSPERQAASCRKESCRGQYPGFSRCNRDARTESTITEDAYAVRLRFSPSCATVWSEVETDGRGGTLEVSIRSGADELLASHRDGVTHGKSSPMLPATSPKGAEACVEMADRLACTGAVHLSADLPEAR